MTKTVKLADWVAGLIKELDPKLTPVSDGYAPLAVLVASYVMGAREAAIADGLGYDPEFVGVVGNRLRNAKIWQSEKLNPQAKARWENDGMAMVCDGNVASGQFVVSYDDGDEPLYSLSPEGKRRAETMLQA